MMNKRINILNKSIFRKTIYYDINLSFKLAVRNCGHFA